MFAFEGVDRLVKLVEIVIIVVCGACPDSIGGIKEVGTRGGGRSRGGACTSLMNLVVYLGLPKLVLLESTVRTCAHFEGDESSKVWRASSASNC